MIDLTYKTSMSGIKKKQHYTQNRDRVTSNLGGVTPSDVKNIINRLLKYLINNTLNFRSLN